MRRRPALLCAAAALGATAPAATAAAQPPPTVELRPGLVITGSVRVRPGTYRLPPAHPDSALVTVRGRDVVVDMRGVRLVGLDEEADPDRASGIAVRIDGGERVRVHGATIRGYRVAILARGTRALELADNDVSHGWKPRLFSGVQHESLVDWLSYHRNERGEWLRFGAGIYLDSVRGGEIRGNRAEQGMNGLLMTRTDSVLVWNNVLSFNSGLGIGMYRSSHNRIVHNHANLNVRGYSHGFFRRGQDSAALLMFEQCSDNVVAYNSMTHGGDGLFLWAGQHTMDTGQGGSNDNLFFGNDFSWAPTNGMEATFSRNAFVANRVVGNDHGLWGGYGFGSRVVGNRFARNRIAIAVEHGQENVVAGNAFDGDSTAIRLWANPIEPSDWEYPKHRDTRSRDWRIEGNTFRRHRVALRLGSTSGVVVRGNDYEAVDSVLALVDTAVRLDVRDDAVTALGRREPVDDTTMPPLHPEAQELAPRRHPSGLDPAASPWRARARSAIVVDAWGPYDWRSPKLWPADSGRGAPMRLQVLGPAGRWRVAAREGIASLSRTSGHVPDTITVTPQPGREGDWTLELEYVGAATVSPRGTRRPAGVPVRFAWTQWAPPIAWTARWFAWGATGSGTRSDTTADVRADAAALARLLAGPPVAEHALPRIDVYGFGAPMPGLPRERVALDATATVTLPPGEHTLRLISEDAARVWVDDRLAIDAWAPHESRPSYASLSGGTRRIRVQYLQTGGWTELRLDLLRGAVPRSAGSPGPH